MDLNNFGDTYIIHFNLDMKYLSPVKMIVKRPKPVMQYSYLILFELKSNILLMKTSQEENSKGVLFRVCISQQNPSIYVAIAFCSGRFYNIILFEIDFNLNIVYTRSCCIHALNRIFHFISGCLSLAFYNYNIYFGTLMT